MQEMWHIKEPTPIETISDYYVWRRTPWRIWALDLSVIASPAVVPSHGFRLPEVDTSFQPKKQDIVYIDKFLLSLLMHSLDEKNCGDDGGVVDEVSSTLYRAAGAVTTR